MPGLATIIVLTTSEILKLTYKDLNTGILLKVIKQQDTIKCDACGVKV